MPVRGDMKYYILNNISSIVFRLFGISGGKEKDKSSQTELR